MKGDNHCVQCSAILLTCQWHTDNISFRYFNASSKPKSGVSLMHSATGSQNASEKADVFICTDLYQLGSRNFPIQPEYVVVVNNDGKIDKACSKFNWKEFLEKSPKQRVIIVRPNISDEDVLSSSSTPIKAVDDHDAEVCRVGKRARNFDPGQVCIRRRVAAFAYKVLKGATSLFSSSRISGKTESLQAMFQTACKKINSTCLNSILLIRQGGSA